MFGEGLAIYKDIIAFFHYWLVHFTRVDYWLIVTPGLLRLGLDKK